MTQPEQVEDVLMGVDALTEDELEPMAAIMRLVSREVASAVATGSWSPRPIAAAILSLTGLAHGESTRQSVEVSGSSPESGQPLAAHICVGDHGEANGGNVAPKKPWLPAGARHRTEAAFVTDTWVTKRRTAARIEWAARRPACRALQVESTPTGQNVRIFMEPNEETGGAWQSLTVHLPDGGTVEIRGSDFYHVAVRRPDGGFVGWLATDSNMRFRVEAEPTALREGETP